MHKLDHIKESRQSISGRQKTKLGIATALLGILLFVVNQDKKAIVALGEQIKKPLYIPHASIPNYTNAKGLTLAHQKDTINDIYLSSGYNPPLAWSMGMFAKMYLTILTDKTQTKQIPNYASQVIGGDKIKDACALSANKHILSVYDRNQLTYAMQHYFNQSGKDARLDARLLASLGHRYLVGSGDNIQMYKSYTSDPSNSSNIHYSKLQDISLRDTGQNKLYLRNANSPNLDTAKIYGGVNATHICTSLGLQSIDYIYENDARGVHPDPVQEARRRQFDTKDGYLTQSADIAEIAGYIYGRRPMGHHVFDLNRCIKLLRDHPGCLKIKMNANGISVIGVGVYHDWHKQGKAEFLPILLSLVSDQHPNNTDGSSFMITDAVALDHDKMVRPQVETDKQKMQNLQQKIYALSPPMRGMSSVIEPDVVRDSMHQTWIKNKIWADRRKSSKNQPGSNPGSTTGTYLNPDNLPDDTCRAYIAKVYTILGIKGNESVNVIYPFVALSLENRTLIDKLLVEYIGYRDAYMQSRTAIYISSLQKSLHGTIPPTIVMPYCDQYGTTGDCVSFVCKVLGKDLSSDQQATLFAKLVSRNAITTTQKSTEKPHKYTDAVIIDMKIRNECRDHIQQLQANTLPVLPVEIAPVADIDTSIAILGLDSVSRGLYQHICLYELPEYNRSMARAKPANARTFAKYLGEKESVAWLLSNLQSSDIALDMISQIPSIGPKAAAKIKKGENISSRGQLQIRPDLFVADYPGQIADNLQKIATDGRYSSPELLECIALCDHLAHIQHDTTKSSINKTNRLKKSPEYARVCELLSKMITIQGGTSSLVISMACDEPAKSHLRHKLGTIAQNYTEQEVLDPGMYALIQRCVLIGHNIGPAKAEQMFKKAISLYIVQTLLPDQVNIYTSMMHDDDGDQRFADTLGDQISHMSKSPIKNRTIQIQSFFATRADSRSQDSLLYAKSTHLLKACGERESTLEIGPAIVQSESFSKANPYEKPPESPDPLDDAGPIATIGALLYTRKIARGVKAIGIGCLRKGRQFLNRAASRV